MNISLVRSVLAGFALVGCFGIQGASAQGATCPATFATSTSLFLVLTPNIESRTATVSHFTRSGAGARWTKQGPSRLAMLGAKGSAWHVAHRDDAPPRSPIKVEGDGRSPLGLFALGTSFGRGQVTTSGAAHSDLSREDLACVDDLSSASYGRIVPRATVAAGVRHEKMAQEPLYRRGLVIETPVDRATKTGSCIFFHVWRGADKPTAGCVALTEGDVGYLQAQARVDTVVAILPRSDLHRFRACLPESAD